MDGVGISLYPQLIDNRIGVLSVWIGGTRWISALVSWWRRGSYLG